MDPFRLRLRIGPEIGIANIKGGEGVATANLNISGC